MSLRARLLDKKDAGNIAVHVIDDEIGAVLIRPPSEAFYVNTYQKLADDEIGLRELATRFAIHCVYEPTPSEDGGIRRDDLGRPVLGPKCFEFSDLEALLSDSHLLDGWFGQLRAAVMAHIADIQGGSSATKALGSAIMSALECLEGDEPDAKGAAAILRGVLNPSAAADDLGGNSDGGS